MKKFLLSRAAHPGLATLRTAVTGLRVRLILLALVVLVPALGLLVYVADQERENDHGEEKSRMLHLARLAAAEESKIIQSTHQLLQHLAQTPEARGETTRAACDAMMARQIKLYSHYFNLGVIGINGVRFCSVLTPGKAIDLSDRAYFRRAVETREFSVGDYQIGASNGKPGITFGYPVIDAAGALQAVVYAVLDPDWLGKSLTLAQLPPEASLSVVDGRGTILARFPPLKGLVGRPVAPAALETMRAQGSSGTHEGTGGDGVRRMWGFVQLQPTTSGAMYLRVGMPVTAAYAAIDRAFYRNLILLAVTTLLVLIAAWMFSERLVIRPVRRLTAAARRLSKGNRGARTGLPHGESEFGQLARVFDGMADSIQSEEAALARLMTQEQETNQKLVAGMAELERLNREITQLGSMSHALQACQGVEEACTAIVQSGRTLFLTETAALYLMRPSRKHLEYKTGWGGTGGEEALLAPESCWALRRGKAYRFEPSTDPMPCQHVPADAHAAPYVCVPLVAQDELSGLLHIRFPVLSGEPASTAFEARFKLVTTFAAQAGLALANLSLREVLNQQSIRDPLTGLHNRRFLEESLGRELARAQRSKAPLAVIMADIDHFKRFNDTYGHDAGDAVLRSVAQTLKSHIRGSDIVCRLGGEEFTVVLAESMLGPAREKAESLRAAIAALVLSHADQPLGAVTMSFGLAMFPAHGHDSGELLQAADIALYRAKNEGRNRVTISDSGTDAADQRAVAGRREPASAPA
jgi:diguanylate cyclase (GGDEF)-like protein